MPTVKLSRQRPTVPASYLRCIRAYPLTSIRTPGQLAAAQAVLDRLLTGAPPDAGEELYIEALSDLVAAYEDEHEVIPPASDADMLRHLLESRHLTQVELSRATGLPKSSISEVLSGRRRFSRRMLRTLADFFRIDVTVMAGNL